MPRTSDTDRADDPLDRLSVLAGREPDSWQPTGVDEALAVIDEIARFCVRCCVPVTERCTEDQCRGWNLERVAVDYLRWRRLDGAG